MSIENFDSQTSDSRVGYIPAKVLDLIDFYIHNLNILPEGENTVKITDPAEDLEILNPDIPFPDLEGEDSEDILVILIRMYMAAVSMGAKRKVIDMLIDQILKAIESRRHPDGVQSITDPKNNMKFEGEDVYKAFNQDSQTPNVDAP